MEVGSSSGPDAEIDPGWLDDLAAVLKPLGARIRSDLERAPDLGDLLLAIVCVPDTRPLRRCTSSESMSMSCRAGLSRLARATGQTVTH